MSDFGIFCIVVGVVSVVWLLRHKKQLRIKGPGFDFHASDESCSHKTPR